MKHLFAFENIKYKDHAEYIQLREHLVKFVENILDIEIIKKIESWDDAHYYLPFSNVNKNEFIGFDGLYIFNLSHTPNKVRLSFRNSVIKTESPDQRAEAIIQEDTLNKLFGIMNFIYAFPLAKDKWERAGDQGCAEFDTNDLADFIKYATFKNFKVFTSTVKFDL